MEQKEIRFQKKREIGTIISDSFEFLKLEFQPLARIMLVYVLPFLILYAGAQIYFQVNVMSQFDMSDPESLMANIGPFYSNLFLFMLFGLFIQSLLAGTYFSYLEAYIKKGKGNFTLHDISSRFFSNSLLALGAGLVFTFLTLIGTIFCILPGIFVANSLSLAVFIFIHEKKGLSDALSRSWLLVRTQWWNTFALNFLGLLMVYAIGTLLSLPTMIMGFSTGIFAPGDFKLVDFPMEYWIWTGFTSIVSTLLLIVPFTFIAFQYFNLEERSNPGRKVGPDDLIPPA